MTPSETLPQSWVSCTLGDVLEYGSTAKAEPSEIPPDAWVLELEDIEKDTSKVLRRVTFSARRSKSTKNRFRRGDVLYGKLRPYLNKVVRADSDGYCTTEIVPLTPPKGLDGGYLFYWLKHPRFLDYVSSVSHGLNMPRLGTEAGRAAPFVLAPPPEQKRIADKLDALFAGLDACRERLDRVPEMLQRFRQAVLAAATTGDLTKEWRERRDLAAWREVLLKDVALDFAYGSAAKSAKSGKVPVLRMGNIQDGRLDWEDLVYSSDRSEIAKYRLSDGDVLFNRTNSPELVGKTAVYHGEREAIYAGYLIRVRCGASLLPDYLNYCLGSPAGRDYCWRVKTDGVSQSNINATRLSAFSFLLPSVEEQREVIRRVEEILSKVEASLALVASAHQGLKHVTSSVLAKAFRGDLVPQDPNEPAAAALIARMQVERVAARARPRKVRRTSAGKKPPVPRSDRNALRDVILSMQSESFSFEELWARTTGDYETVKHALFELLAESKSVVRQTFDASAKTMKLVRVRQ